MDEVEGAGEADQEHLALDKADVNFHNLGFGLAEGRYTLVGCN